jgi:hypothetical protein
MSIKEQALKEIEEENFRKAVEKHKQRLRLPWWRKIFPWRINLTIRRIHDDIN